MLAKWGQGPTRSFANPLILRFTDPADHWMAGKLYTILCPTRFFAKLMLQASKDRLGQSQPNCRTSNHVNSNGWAKNARRCANIQNVNLAWPSEWKCSNCECCSC